MEYYYLKDDIEVGPIRKEELLKKLLPTFSETTFIKEGEDGVWEEAQFFSLTQEYFKQKNKEKEDKIKKANTDKLYKTYHNYLEIFAKRFSKSKKIIINVSFLNSSVLFAHLIFLDLSNSMDMTYFIKIS